VSECTIVCACQARYFACGVVVLKGELEVALLLRAFGGLDERGKLVKRDEAVAVLVGLQDASQ
jgi:hypothetical protein